VNGGRPQIFGAHSQLPQTPAEGVGFFHLAGEDDVEKGLAEHTFVLPKMIHFVLRRFDLQQFLHSAVVSERILRDDSGQHREHWIAKKWSWLQTLVYGMFRPAHQINCQKSCGDGKALNVVEANLFSGVNVIFFASRTTCMANSAFPCSFRKTPKVMFYTRHSQSVSSLFENSFNLRRILTR